MPLRVYYPHPVSQMVLEELRALVPGIELLSEGGDPSECTILIDGWPGAELDRKGAPEPWAGYRSFRGCSCFVPSTLFANGRTSPSITCTTTLPRPPSLPWPCSWRRQRSSSDGRPVAKDDLDATLCPIDNRASEGKTAVILDTARSVDELERGAWPWACGPRRSSSISEVQVTRGQRFTGKRPARVADSRRRTGHRPPKTPDTGGTDRARELAACPPARFWRTSPCPDRR